MMRFHAIVGAASDRLGGAPATNGEQGAAAVAENIINHIPAEATAFYLMAVQALGEPTQLQLFIAFVLSLVLLIIVRWLGNASRAVWISTIVAFVLWMFLLDKGFLHPYWPRVLPDAWAPVIAGFYSTVVTLLASKGMLK